MLDFDRNKKQQESFGMIQFNRISMGKSPVLFGADVQTHSLIQLTISKNAYMTDSKLMGRSYTASRSYEDNVCEVIMTHAQFADLITCMNMGEGIPCTIQRIGTNRYEPLSNDDIDNVIDAERQSMKEACEDMVAEAARLQAEIDKILEKPSISKADRATIRNYTDRIQTQFAHNMPFYIQKAGEAIEKLTERAKTELGASIQSSMIMAGCQALGVEMKQPTQQLISGDETENA